PATSATPSTPVTPVTPVAPTTTPASPTKVDETVRFEHQLRSRLRVAEYDVRGLPAENLFEWRTVFRKFFRTELMRDLVEHEDSLVNPYILDVNYRNKRIPRNVEINRGNEAN